jgi:hypothetical protein
MSKPLPDVQKKFAAILEVFVIIGLGLLVITFVLYVSGAVPAVIPVEEVPEIWGMRAAEFLDDYPRFQGWSWITSLAQGDVMSFASLVLLALTIILSFTILLVLYLRRRDWVYAAIVGAEIAVLISAASGVLTPH